MVSASRLKHLFLPLLLLGVAAPIAQPATAQIAAAEPAELAGLDAYIEKARADWQVPGVAVAIVKDDRIVYAHGFGVREAGKPGAVDADTVFAIGSATKAFTGAALAMLVDEKKIAWDGKVQEYMPGFALADPYVTAHVTVRDMLSHRTGFVSGYGWVWTGSGFDRAEVVRRLRYQTNNLGFRDHFSYANEIFTTAGEIVPAVTGTSWDAFVARRFFAPLGMTRSSTSIAALKGLGNVATPHGLIEGKLVTFPYRMIDNVGGAGAINSSVRDMAQWVRLQLGDGVYDGKRLIGAASIAETHTGQIAVRGMTNPGGLFGEYGFGWIVDDYRGQKVIQHNGGVDGMQALVAMLPAQKLGIVLLSNRLGHKLTTAVALRVFDAYLGAAATDWNATFKAEDDAAKAKAEERKTAAASASGPAIPVLPLDRYAGSYVSAENGRLTVTVKNGALFLARPAMDAPLIAERDGHFLARWRDLGIRSVYGDTPITFATDASGKVTAVDLGPDRFDRE